MWFRYWYRYYPVCRNKNCFEILSGRLAILRTDRESSPACGSGTPKDETVAVTTNVLKQEKPISSLHGFYVKNLDYGSLAWLLADVAPCPRQN